MSSIKYFSKVLTKIIYTLCLLVLFISILSYTVSGRFSFFGYKPIYVMTGSMEPVIPTHSFVLGKSANANDLSVGDIAVYKRPIYVEGKGACSNIFVVHRIIKKTVDGGFVFKGDANSSADETIVYGDQIMYKIIGR